MSEASSRSLSDLFAAVTAHLRGDDGAVQMLIGEVVTAGRTSVMSCAAVMTSAEYLRDAAMNRQMDAPRMVDLLLGAHRLMTGAAHVPTAEGTLLAGVGEYLRGRAVWWDQHQMDVLMRHPYATAMAAIRVTSGALAWHARDIDHDPIEVASRTCLGLAERRHLTT